jgi:hypothetical protein
MKKIKAGRKVLTGRILEGTYNGPENRIQLFDGKFTTGYRIVSFQIAPVNPALGNEIIGKLTTEPKSTVTQWFWEDVQELAWCHWGQDKYQDTFTNIREDNMVIEDLWISIYNETFDGATVNYEIILEKYEFPAWTGAGVLVENLSQAGPQ